REIEAGQGPTLSEDAAGSVRGVFPDQVTATLPRGVLLRDAPCTCGSVAVCRHRVAVALAYAKWKSAASVAAAPPSAPAWSPSTIDDAALAKLLGARVLDRARRLAQGPLVVTVTPGATPEAALPTCTVRFLVPNDPTYAKCDCVAGGACEHVGLAVFAFREAEKEGALEGPRIVELGGAAEGPQAGPLDEALVLARAVLLEGVVHATKGIAQRFSRAEAALERARLEWPLAVVVELRDVLRAYDERSAIYRPAVAARLLAELAARARAASRKGELPASHVLGAGEPRETLLEQVRLVALGARVTGTELGRTASVFLADPDSATVLVLERTWTVAEGETPPPGHELAKRSIATGVKLDILARGQLVSRAVKRRANRSIALGAGGVAKTTVLAQPADGGSIPPALLAKDLEALGAAIAGRPPRLISPRVLAEDVRVVKVTGVEEIHYAPGAQVLTALLHVEGGTILVERHHSAAAPRALDVLAAALEAKPSFVSGEVRRSHGGLVLDPLALHGERIALPDLDDLATPSALELGRATDERTPIESALERAQGVLDALVHSGLRRDPPIARVKEAAAALDQVGLAETAKKLGALAEALRKLAEQRDESAVAAWFDAAIRLTLVTETTFQ
ncbi:MAG: hypothetical protein ACAI25_05435, partial [Planctomycetota bacterium]